MKRQRGRGRKAGSPSNRSYESNGPDVKVRGAPSHIYDKYMQLARDASSAGDRVMAENYYQHAEHYLRIVQANQPKRDEREDNNGNQDDADGADEAAEGQNDAGSDNASGSNQAEDAPRQRRPRGRRRRDEPSGSDDPLQVVDPESTGASSSTPSEDGDSQPSTEEKPKKRTRTRRPKADVDAQKALDAADGEGEKRSSKDAGEAA